MIGCGAGGAWAIALALGAALLGAILGSFIATLCLRWPLGQSVLAGRSRCDGCGRQLGALELVPLASALASHGRCRHCAAPIDPFHWRVEAAAAAIGGAALLADPGPGGAALALFGWLLLPLMLLDWRHYWLPDRLTALLALGGLAGGGLLGLAGLAERLIGGIAGFAVLALIAALYRRVRGRDGMGAADPRLMGAIGLWIGWSALAVTMLAAAAIGLAVAAWRGRMTASTAVPFGTMLGAGAWLVALILLASSRAC